MWHIVPVPDSTFVKVKSVIASGDSIDGYCLGVVPQEAGALGGSSAFSGLAIGDEYVGKMPYVENIMSEDVRQGMDFSLTEMKFNLLGDGWGDHDMCSNGSKLGLVSCDHPSSQWYSTDGQLISPYCSSIGLSSFLSVNEECTDLQLSTTSDGATAISRAETFLAVTQEFVETIPPPPPAPTYYPTDNPTTATDTPTSADEVGYGYDVGVWHDIVT